MDKPDKDPNHTKELSPEETPSEAVVHAVAEATNQPPLEMKPLTEVIDPVALNNYIACADEKESSIRAMFDYCGCHVIATPSEIQIHL